ncbi:MAG: type I-E CRISPR-associated protein Cas6/Cse3/CasE [Desulfocapsa sp.]|nr:type I-E CRISPR-associated protein Cas6/Cse3/CasE [Desulfocapsa sp.]
MYLSKCLITSRKPMNPYEVHRKIWDLFPDRQKAKRDFLFRMEQSTPTGHPVLLQSTFEPVSVKGGPVVLGQKEINYFFKTGMVLQFFLTANPTRRIRARGDKTSNQGRCRVPLIDEDEIRDWLKRKFTDVGLLHEVIIAGKSNLYFRKKGRPGKIVTVNYTGLLSVDDPESLANLVENGIGPAKAFGCGLLSLARM